MSAPSTAELAAHLVTTAGAVPEDSILLAQLIGDRLRWNGDGAPTVLDPKGMPAFDASGVPVTPSALIGTFAREMPTFFKVSVSPMQPQNGSGRIVMTGATARAAAEHQASLTRPSTGKPANPYAKATSNLTEQVRLEARDPARAAQLKAEAGAR